MAQAPQRSQRFTQAATNERNRLARKRDQLSKKRSELQQRLNKLDAELETLDQEITVLDSFATGENTGELALAAETASRAEANLLSGGAIRGFAVPLLIRERGSAPIHYREWQALVEAEGFKIAGKRPEAVFLNQVTRSPLIKATTSAGYYQLDPEAPDRLHALLSQQQQALTELMRQIPRDTASIEEHRQKQQELNTAIAKTQRELQEADNALAEAQRSELPKAA
jgi:peptidoglycan hydrolase CwlO-like protein